MLVQYLEKADEANTTERTYVREGVYVRCPTHSKVELIFFCST